jgi:DNA-directed RNA polymerase subunit L
LRVNTIKRAGSELRIEIEGEGHTLCNLLQNTLLKDRSVEMAGYDVPHPLTQKAVLYIKARKEHNPEKALERALRKISEMTDEFLQKLREASGRQV